MCTCVYNCAYIQRERESEGERERKRDGCRESDDENDYDDDEGCGRTRLGDVGRAHERTTLRTHTCASTGTIIITVKITS